MPADLLVFNERGIYCPQADVFIDPWKPVQRALITHAHSDHARPGHQWYASTPETAVIMRHRLGSHIQVQAFAYGTNFLINGVRFSFHPAGHIPGSAQIRVEYKGEIWVASGDYKLHNDHISAPFEPVKCHTLITESTFGLPIFHWEKQEHIFEDMHQWIAENKQKGINSVLIAYSLGKAQRILKQIAAREDQILVHGAVAAMQEALSEGGLPFETFQKWMPGMDKKEMAGMVLVAPPSVIGSRWIKRFEHYSLGVCSGWMAMRGTKRRRGADKGFVLSDHADWNELNTAVKESGAERVIVTHGYTAQFSRHLQEKGLRAENVQTLYGEGTEEESVLDSE